MQNTPAESHIGALVPLRKRLSARHAPSHPATQLPGHHPLSASYSRFEDIASTSTVSRPPGATAKMHGPLLLRKGGHVGVFSTRDSREGAAR